MRTLLLLSLGITTFAASGCGMSRQYEKYNDLVSAGLDSGDFTLTPQNHPHGYARANCFNCHVTNNIHMRDLAESGLLSTAKASESDVRNCTTLCHGDNGVTP